jgi:hypothetical protein
VKVRVLLQKTLTMDARTKRNRKIEKMNRYCMNTYLAATRVGYSMGARPCVQSTPTNHALLFQMLETALLG